MKEPGEWRRIPKMSFSSKELSKRLKKAEGATIKHAQRFVFKRWDSFREARSKIAIWVLVLGVIIGATGLQFWWYQASFSTTTGASGGTYAEAVVGPVDTLNPLFARTSAEEAVGELLFSRLLQYDSTGHLNYDLADNMSLSDDHKTYTLSIRPDARWSDGLYVRARDVVFTVNLVKNAATRATLTGWDSVQVQEIDDLTVSFTLPAVYAAFPHALRFLPVVPEHILRDVEPSQLREHSFSSSPIGSGAFTLRLVQEIDAKSGREVIHLARNANYFKGEPKLDRVQLNVYSNTDSIKKALAASEVNAAGGLSVLDASELNNKRYTVEFDPINSGVFALFNTTSPNLQDQKVRAALRLATNTSALREEISSNLPALDLPIIPAQLTGQIPQPPAQNLEQAGKLLDEAGWRLDGSVRRKDGSSLNLNAVTIKNSDYEKALGILSSQWRALGVTVTINVVDPTDASQNVAQDILQPRRFDVLLYQLTIGADPDVFAYWHSTQASGGLNFSNYKNAIADDALSSARTRVEPELRNAKYLTFVRQWLADAPAIGLYQATTQYVHTAGVQSSASTRQLISPQDRYNDIRYLTVGRQAVFMTP